MKIPKYKISYEAKNVYALRALKERDWKKNKTVLSLQAGVWINKCDSNFICQLGWALIQKLHLTLF